MAAVQGPIVIKQLAPAIGAIIEGVDLAKPMDQETQDQITEALLTYKVIFFQKQDMTPQQHRDFAKRFGELHIHPFYPNVDDAPEIIILDTHAKNIPDNDNWHTDVTCIKTPPMGSILMARMLPPCGGDTSWSCNITAYNALSAPLQKLLDGLTAFHDFRKSFPVERYGNEEKWAEAVKNTPPTVHPVVRVHPVTGKKGLFVNSGFTTRIVELTKGESDLLLEYLFAHSGRPEFTVRWRWSVGDVAFWDNRLTQHYALADYMPHRRIMNRATVLGDVPKGPLS
ncbi:Alpha-ketoglutarate-dependent taurine dioxygenase [Hypsibius exemplaris]|uniref:Alpha-ketoglutarate-dependent taurine dioxygenase n=1 Tax=Hypsibius exemplaris TaxID=2072580 RepID=A0A1W0WT41_HYPEX|nr:Alpha-ketoglutarate-dependent taurine dioxygenase [Hypsibius exemplaris]